MKLKLAGHFTLRAVDANTGATRELADFDNLILDAGLNRLGTGGVGYFCVVGSGSTAPAVSNTQLVSTVASNSSPSITDGASSGAPYYGYARASWRFPQGAAAGNLSEVGVGWATDALFSRALIKDSNDNPTTITVLSTEFLDVIYEFRVYAPTADITYNATICGVSRAVTARGSYVSYWGANGVFQSGFNLDNQYGGAGVHDGAIGTVTQLPSGSSVMCGIQTDSYSNNSYKKTGAIQIGLDQANYGTGIRSVSFGGSNYSGIRYQAEMNPTVTKNNTQTVSLNIEVSWGR